MQKVYAFFGLSIPLLTLIIGLAIAIGRLYEFHGKDVTFKNLQDIQYLYLGIITFSIFITSSCFNLARIGDNKKDHDIFRICGLMFFFATISFVSAIAISIGRTTFIEQYNYWPTYHLILVVFYLLRVAISIITGYSFIAGVFVLYFILYTKFSAFVTLNDRISTPLAINLGGQVDGNNKEVTSVKQVRPDDQASS